MRKFLLSLIISLSMMPAANADIVFTPDRKLVYAEKLIAGYYVDEVDTAKIVEDAIIAMLKDLDPHSTYTNADETRELTEPLAGNFSGIGVRFQMVRDTLYVIESVAGGPCEKVGIIPGDRIIACNDTVISGVKMPNSGILKVLRGPRGTRANLKVLRHGEKEPTMFAVTRDDIPIYSVDASYMVNDSIGFISIARFAETTTEEFNKAMQKLKKEGMKHLIIDLCDNGGGYLRPATELANKFLRRGDMIVYTDSKKNGGAQFVAENDGDFLDGRVVVMVNQYSASASEILSGALQDNDRAIIVGRRTFGKGLVQRPFPFPDGSMIRLTVSRYYTPSGRCIQKPYNSGDDDAYSNDINNRFLSGELTNADSVAAFPDSLLRHTLRLGRPVYGGGGIMPDRFVALDTTYFTKYYRGLMAKGSISLAAVNYVDANRKSLLKKYPTERDFINGWEPDEKLFRQLIESAKADGVEFNEEDFEISRPYISKVIKGIVGRDLYEQETYFKIVNPINPIFNSAVEELINYRL